jgi:hypothetical protein
MNMVRFVQLGVLMLSAISAWAQTPATASPAPLRQAVVPTSSNEASHSHPTNLSLLLSNNAVLILAEARGVKADAVKVRFSDAMSGRFEIHPDGAKDLQREAELLSRNFGTNIAVIVDEATTDGRLRTNYVFRGGLMRRTVAPILNRALPPGGRRMYVWPETSQVAAPANVRLVRQSN